MRGLYDDVTMSGSSRQIDENWPTDARPSSQAALPERRADWPRAAVMVLMRGRDLGVWPVGRGNQ